VLHGLLRVRGFTQDDAHHFCSPEQMPQEIDFVLNFCLDMLRAFGFHRIHRLSEHPTGKSRGRSRTLERSRSSVGASLKRPVSHTMLMQVVAHFTVPRSISRSRTPCNVNGNYRLSNSISNEPKNSISLM
jgi:threonyl-tRNA synthetase